MGERKLLRWERRRRRGQSARDARAFKSFWGFEFVLLILIFSIWLIGARLIQIYAVVTSPCAEMAAAIGQSGSGSSAFDLFFWVSVLTGLYWAVIGAAFWRTLWRSKSALFHSALLICIALLMANFRMMHMDNNMPPDGTLAIEATVVDRSSGKDQYYQAHGYGEKYSRWVLSEALAKEGAYYQNTQHCVWLSRNLIVDDYVGRIDGYGALLFEEKHALFESIMASPHKIALKNPPTSFVKEIKAIWLGAVKTISPLETLQERQVYRPLTPKERARFIAKQQCIHDTAFTSTQIRKCQYYWVYDYQAANFDFYMGNNPGP